MTPLLQISLIAKSFAGVRALKGVSFDLQAGEVHALVGENGAGKSTFIKIITGVETQDSGALEVSGETVRRMDPHLSRRLGIAAIYQQPALFPDLTVAENIALAIDHAHPWRRVDWPGRRRQAAALLDRVGAALDPGRLVGTLSMPEQQVVEIAKAVGANARILLMDEPTASLSRREVERLFAIIAALRKDGAGIIYISHRLDEVLAVADRITVLRDGESVVTLPTRQATHAELIRLMVGRELSAVFPKGRATPGDVALELRNVSHADSGLHDISLSVRRGEILGVSGLVGAGRTELAEVLFGLRPADGGDILVDGVRVRIESPAHAVALGLAYVPEDRRQHGILPPMSVAANTSVANLAGVSRRGFISSALERQQAQEYVERFRIKTPALGTPVETLSGGNQQKVALAKWLSTRPRVLLLDEPTQGVDVGAKAEIHALMRQLAEDGVAILMISSELPEILGMSDRIAVMRAGGLAGIVDRGAATADSLMALAL